MQRVVTGHTENGKSVFASTGEPPRIVNFVEPPIPEFSEPWLTELWGTDDIPTVPLDGGDPTVTMRSFVPAPGGTRFRITRIAPQQKIKQSLEKGINLEERLKSTPDLAGMFEPEHPGMHTTNTVDYGIVISGEVSLELDDGAEIHLKPGDCVVQNGTRHAWRNRGSDDCVMAFIMVGAKRNK
ncbi:cupin domain-containing protein [Chloroflexota bacterium]